MRFRIRTVMLLAAALAISSAIAETATRDYRKRRQVEADLRSMGAYYVSFDDSNAPSWVGFVAPVGLKRIGDYKSFDNLDFAGANVTNDTVHGVSSLKHVRTLHFTNCNVTDAQLGTIAHIGSIYMLRLNGSPVTDEAIPAIASIRGLQSLDVSGTLITPAGIAELKQRRPEIVVRRAVR